MQKHKTRVVTFSRNVWTRENVFFNMGIIYEKMLGYPKGQSTLWHTIFRRVSLVCYTFCNRRRQKGIETSFLNRFLMMAARKRSAMRTFAAQTFFVRAKRDCMILGHSENLTIPRVTKGIYSPPQEKALYKNISFRIF